MGGSVKQAVASVAAPVKSVVQNVSADISGGRPLDAVKDLGKGAFNVAKLNVGLTPDNKFIGAQVGKAALADFKADPMGAIQQAGAAYATGGASLAPVFDSSVLQAIGSGVAPGQLKNAPAAAAPPTQEAAPIQVIQGGSGGMGLVYVGVAALALILILKR